jgi:hypothetical protein
MLLALSAWLLPISAIITPYKLIVTSRTSIKTMLSTITAVDFADYPRWARVYAIGNYSFC